ncbi:MAG: hypothetical protein KGI10_08300 [Thaumarchaeota archaeon]|nr:hypothetical protein [Nitrososphaerota archaeon]
MESNQKVSRSSKVLLIVGFVAIAASFLAYWKNNNLIVTPAAMPALQRLAVSTYVVLFASFGAIGLGLYRFYKTKTLSTDDSITTIISNAINNKRSKQILLVSAIGYAIFFGFTSGVILYKPDINATDFGFPKPPYAEISPCCNVPGYMPMILIFFTEHIGLQIIPLNLVLLVTVSFLVGLNFALASETYSIARKSSKIGSIGAVTGLFVGCPTCAGTAFMLLFGLGASASTTVTTIFLTTHEIQLQTIFIAVSIPILLVTPLVMARNIRRANLKSCTFDSEQ